MAVAALLVVGVQLASSTPPLYRITASSHYDAGKQQGMLAAAKIRGWLQSPEMLSLTNFTAVGPGREALTALKRDNTDAYPELADELRGIADGANLSVDIIWASTLISELESLQPTWPRRPGHCTDVYAAHAGGTVHGFAHGHNEDWPGSVHQFYYFVSYTAAPGSNFTSCAGLVYPGSLLGWASTWNAEGMYLTQNSLFPRVTRASGLGSGFVQRDAICGRRGGGRRGMDHVISRLSVSGWSSGASVNLVDLVERRMANLESHLDRTAVYELPARSAAANYSHMNMYKELEVGVADEPDPSTLHRQARLDSLPPPRSVADVRARLSDHADATYPVFRTMTLATMVLDGSEAKLQVWCCGLSAVSGAPPVYTWDVMHFFGNATMRERERR